MHFHTAGMRLLVTDVPLYCLCPITETPQYLRFSINFSGFNLRLLAHWRVTPC